MRSVVVLALALLLMAPLVVALSPPSAPQTPAAATGTNVGEIDLSWTAPAVSGASPVAGYRIYRSLTATGLTHLVDVGNILAFTDNTVPDGAPRFYRFSAVNGDGEGPLSSAVSAQAKWVPSAPLSFVPATGPDRNNITLNWAAPQYDGLAAIAVYNVYRAATWTGPFSLLGSVAPLTYLDLSLGDNVTFAYYVTAVNAHGEGAPTEIRNGTTAHLPGPPLNVRATGTVTKQGIVVEWDPPADGGGLPFRGWRIDRSIDGGTFQPYHLITPDDRDTLDEKCPILSNCTYRVAARSIMGFGAVSSTATAEGDALPVINRCALC